MVIDRMKVLKMWNAGKIMTNRMNEMKHLANLIFSYKEHFYDPVEKSTGVPWYVVGAIDCRESSFNHGSYLGNGDPLYKVTKHVPRGRGPFKSWYDGAIDAFDFDGMNHLPPGGHWDIVTALIKCESYNGMGYASKGLPSPYVWGGTTIQQAGKYVADGHFSATTWDTQPGCAGIFMALKLYRGIDVGEA